MREDAGERVGHRGCGALQEIFAGNPTCGPGIAPGEQSWVIAPVKWDCVDEEALNGPFQLVQKGEALAMSCLRIAIMIDIYCCARGTHSLGTSYIM